jgi:hypothetical protein
MQLFGADISEKKENIYGFLMTDDSGDIQSRFKIYLEASQRDYFDTSGKVTTVL